MNKSFTWIHRISFLLGRYAFYAWAVKNDRNYILSFLHGKVGWNIKYAFCGAITGFGFLPLINLFVVGVMYALSYHYFDTIWFAFTTHMVRKFAQDFIFWLSNSGQPAVVSIFNSMVTGSSFFYDEVFGIEGSIMAILVNLIACGVVILIGGIFTKKLTINEPYVKSF